ncbi:hypothetical protein SDC9_137839 [bioreactor metagenome]|uniref:DUF2946 domain-containing protein n=1 Tax=bioreactor metagenome TaxID=1076179 RepID=A0A645DN50_9ZZZZ
MLEPIRQSRRLAAAVTAVFAVLLMVAMLSGVRVRAVTQHDGAHAQHAWMMAADICTSHGAVDVDLPAQAPLDADHAGHHGADCVLCIALAPPLPFEADVHRPSAPAYRMAWSLLGDGIPAAPRGAAFPPRGPPVALV